MKIAFFKFSRGSIGGGLEKYFIKVSQELPEYEDAQVDIITMDEKNTQMIEKLLNIYYQTKNKKLSSKFINKELFSIECSSFKELRRVLNNYDVIYSKNELLEAFFLKFFIKYKRIPPVIFGCHTSIYYPIAKSFQSKIHNFLYNGFFYKWLASGVVAFHTLNSFEENTFKKLFPHKKVKKIYNPLCLDKSKEDFKKLNFSFPKNKFNISWIGRLTEQKGIDDLVYFINKINKSKYRDEISWIIAGSGAEQNKIVNLVNKWNNVKFLGYIESMYMNHIYLNSDLNISTSKWESFGLTILEAQSFGVPVIAYDIPGPRDIIKNKETGSLVINKEQFIDEIFNFIKGKAEYGDIKAYILEKFNKKRIYKELAGLFNGVCILKKTNEK